MSQFQLDPASLSATAMAASASAAPPARLVSAAHEFEAAMMKELLAPLEPGHDPLDGKDDGEDSSSALTSFAGEAMGKAISEHGGLGIAKSILHQLTHSGNHSGKSAVPGNPIGTHSNSPSQ
jgi:Rod binding domain-containing protein